MQPLIPGAGDFRGFLGGVAGPPAGESQPHDASPVSPSMRLNLMANPGLFGGGGLSGLRGGGAGLGGIPGGGGVLGGVGDAGGSLGGTTPVGDGSRGGLSGAFPGMFPGRFPGRFPLEPPAEPPPPPPPPPAGTGPAIGIRPGLRIPPDIRFPPGLLFPPLLQITKTATQLARSAMVTLTNATPDVVEEALNTLRGRNVAADHLLEYLERRVRVGEVLNQLASTWSDTTVGDFADAFQMDRAKRDVMDAIVAIGILNDPELDDEILVENTAQTSEQDLLDNRVIVDQWPPGGTVMEPPYMVLVAVEYRDVADARQIVDSIVSELVDHQGVKLPRPAAERLRARG